MYVDIYKKNVELKIGFRLKLSEMDCKCTNESCHYTLVSSKLTLSWNRLRKEVGSPITVTSGFRCQEHNFVSLGKLKSRHTTGQAMDLIPHKSVDLVLFIKRCEEHFDYVQVYNKFNGDFWFIHCHVDL